MAMWNIFTPEDHLAARQFYGISGNNPFNTPLRMAGLGFGSRVLDQIGFGNQLEPVRQDLLNYALNQLSVRNNTARLQAFANHSASQAAQSARLLQAQAGGRTPNLSDAFLSQAAQATNSFARGLNSPEQLSDQVSAALELVNQGQSTAGLGLLASLAGQLENIVGSQNARHRNAGGGLLGGLLQSASQLAGMGVFGRPIRQQIPAPFGQIGAHLNFF